MSNLKLLVQADLTNDTLVLRYSVDNRTDRDVYLLNRVHDRSLQTNPDLVYISLVPDKRIANIYKGIPPIPPGMNPTMPQSPYVTPLRSHQRFEESVRIRLPVREQDAYLPAEEHRTATKYRGIRFSIGYYPSAPGIKERTQQIVSGVEALIVQFPPGIQPQIDQLVEDLVLEFPVLAP